MVWAVVPFECHAGKAVVIEFFGDFVVFPDGLAKMIQMGIANLLNIKVVNNECKYDRAPLVTPETRGDGCLIVFKFSKVVLADIVS
jgi:hypothetical protein